jgi:hypothetical protein
VVGVVVAAIAPPHLLRSNMKHKNPEWYEKFKQEMLELIEKYESEQKIAVKKITLVALGPTTRDIDMIINRATDMRSRR